jgi:hypothetical protein
VNQATQRLDIPLVDGGSIGKRGDSAVNARLAQQVQCRVRRTVGAVRDGIRGAACVFMRLSFI